VDSYHVQSPIKQSGNLSACKMRLESLVNDLQSNYTKWKLAQQRGTSLCYVIEAKKTRCLDADPDEGSGGSFPEDLLSPTEKLDVITTIFCDIHKNTSEILREMRALVKLSGTACETIFYRTWKLEQFVSFTKELLNRYSREVLVKRRVMKSIAHCTKRSELIGHTTAWEFPQHVDTYVDLVFMLLAEEVKLK
ncbi:hypothetical protein KR222_010018, partial [Zaprionus bogoriensis]